MREPSYVDPRPTLEHIVLLQDLGWTATQIAKEAGKDTSTVTRILDGRYKHIHRNTANAIQSIEPARRLWPSVENALDLLTIDGGWWTPENLAHRLSMNPGACRRMLHRFSDVFETRPDPRDPTGNRLEWRARVRELV